jgi:hypothetical protein
MKNFCQFRKELINNQAILYQVFSADEEKMTREENFIDISHAVKIKLEVAENDSYNSNEIFESEATMNDVEIENEQIEGSYQFKLEEQNQNDLSGIYSKF